MEEIKKIGFVGTGIMGGAMAGHLLDAGYELTVYNRTKSRAEDLLKRGAVWADTAGQCAAGQDLVITMVGYPKDVEEIYLAPDGILAHAKPGAVVVDMTTSSPTLAARIYEEAKKKNVAALDAPVTGGDTGAQAGTLTILAGGDEDVYRRVLPIFEKMGKTISYHGAAGNGQHVKMCNQIAVAGALAGACEAIAYGRAVGLDIEKTVGVLGTGAAGSFQLDHVASRGMNGDFAPGFMLKHFVKDLNIADASSIENGLKLDVTQTIRDIAEYLEHNGHAQDGTQSLLFHYEGGRK